MSHLPAELVELASLHGVATEYWDWRQEHVRVPAETVTAVLAGLGVSAGDRRSARAALAEARRDRWRAMVAPSLVVRAGQARSFGVHVPAGERVTVWVELEDGGLRHDLVERGEVTERVDGVAMSGFTYELPADLPLGWHRLHARTRVRTGTGALVVVPVRLALPAAVRDRRGWGFLAQLYALRSRRSWGLGDLADLAELASWSGRRLGASFVLVNPLHAAGPAEPIEPSPYLPTSRRFVSPLYLRVEEIPEVAHLDPAASARVRELAAAQRARNGTGALLDRDAVWAAKRAALELVHQVPRGPGRAAAYQDFLTREGEGLESFATWCVLAEQHGPDWREWPVELRDPASARVAAAGRKQAERVDFYCWLQWLLDEQLGAAQRAATAAGMPVGVVHDLAVGVHRGGADAWALREVFAQGITVGAPPDGFNQQGQDWSQPPWRPDRLAESGYAPYRQMLRAVLRHAGAIRIDHVIGLFRLWWVPEGRPPTEGTYVRYDHEALIGILVLEAQRAGAVVLGEDLGTVEPWMREYLRERGLFGTSILWFEKGATGEPLPPQRWRELCLATVTTHDLPPAAGYLAGEHVRLRERLGLLARPVEEERAVDEADRRAWLELLAELGLLRPGAGEQEVVEALHRFLAWTPCRLVGVSLADAVGDRRVHNQPGTSDEYPNWRLPLTDAEGRPVLLDDLVDSSRIRSLAQVLGSV